MNRRDIQHCWIMAFVIVWSFAVFAVVVHAITEQRRTPMMYIWVGYNCKAGPVVLSEDDTDPALEACERVDTHVIKGE